MYYCIYCILTIKLEKRNIKKIITENTFTVSIEKKSMYTRICAVPEPMLLKSQL